jgi:hypothetical protein
VSESILTDRPGAFHEVLARDLPRPFPAERPVDLSGARVAVLGCGSVGSLAAWCLAGAGVTGLDLADRDRLGPGNLRRHACGAHDLGRPKAEAVAGLLGERFPRATLTPHHFCFLERPDLLRALIQECDVALSAVDDEAPKHLADTMAGELGIPVVYAGVYGGGWACEAVLVDRQADTPCYACAARALGRVGVPVQRPMPGLGYALPDPGVAPSEWVTADLTSILPCAALAARLVTAWLARRRGAGGAWQEFRGAGASAWRLALRQVPGWGFGPWELRPVPVRRQPGCPGCAIHTASPTELARLLEDGAR